MKEYKVGNRTIKIKKFDDFWLAVVWENGEPSFQSKHSCQDWKSAISVAKTYGYGLRQSNLTKI